MGWDWLNLTVVFLLKNLNTWKLKVRSCLCANLITSEEVGPGHLLLDE